MRSLTTMAVLAALAGCAGVQGTQGREFAAGHWTGEIDRDGWVQPLAIDIQQENGTYRGELRSLGAGKSLESVEVRGDQVRLETDKLRFVGHVSGSTLSGTVANKLADAPAGEFSVTSAPAVYSPGSEWSMP